MDMFEKKHDRLCRCAIDLRKGRVIQIVFADGKSVSGKVTKKDKHIFVGSYRLNGKLITGVYPKY